MTHTERLVVVRRHQFASFALLAEAFADEPNVRLVWDRRSGERRRASAAPAKADQRNRDRRDGLSLAWGTSDYLLLTLDGRPAPATSPSNAGMAREAQADDAHSRLIGETGREIDAAAMSDLSVLISGGDPVSRKSLAHRIHRRSARCTQPFVVVDREAFVGLCVAIDGRDRSRGNGSKGGTLLIEDVAQWNWRQQSELVRFLERILLPLAAEGESWARLIAGTDDWLHDRVVTGEFREDLFYRLNAIHLVLPAGVARAAR